MIVFGSGDDCCFTEVRLKQSQKGVRVSIGSISSDGFLVQDISFRQNEKAQILSCFSEKNYAYVFGHSAETSTLTVTGLVTVCAGNNSLNRATINYKNGRVSNSKNIATISYGTSYMRGILVSMDSSTYDLSANLQRVSYTFQLVKPIGGA